tara:strand:+ start:314 stop:487 length:174 start_codon:yes stop_codon:yes gene_type:complete
MRKPTKQDQNKIAHWMEAVKTELAKGALGGFLSYEYINEKMTRINETLELMKYSDRS